MSAIKMTGPALALLGALTLSACVPMHGPGWQNDHPPIAHSRDLYPGYGQVQSVEPLRHESNSSIGLGAIAGAVVGGLIGHQVGEGKGNTAATVIGAAGGALIGHQIEKQTRSDQVRINIRMENGSSQQLVVNDERIDLRPGDRIHIDRDGAIRRY